ncbi:MAG: dihydrodipicolinate synthase family protein [Alphaproteobacteria bacterium]|nr:dihydrodipicolinate synthase family protein [Alphaproteobacteria bacterium]
MHIRLPTEQFKLAHYTLKGEPLKARKPTKPFNRVAFAAAHVVADPLRGGVDWDTTMAYRRHLLGLGFGIAEAMDTSQRGMGLDWPVALELVKRSLADAGKEKAKLIYSGCGTDHLNPADAHSLEDVIKAYLAQLHAIQKLGGRIILMASRALVRVARSPDDYVKVYAAVLREADHPVVLHWLGPMFDPALDGYWGTHDFNTAMETCLAMINANVAKVDGIKISLLDAKKEITMRRRLPASFKMYTGDDFNYAELIAGDKQGYSHALLGIFDAIAPAASLALSALAKGDEAKFHALLGPTVPLSRLIFQAPTQYYKTGIVFLAWLNGHQDHFIMVAGAQSARPLSYFVEIFKLADQAGLLRKPELAITRMKHLLVLYGAA